MRLRLFHPSVVAGLAAVVFYERALRPWHERWGATDTEVAARLPGDDLIDEPAFQVTRAIGIEVPPQQVWPWVIQLGADRGGFYSYDWLENLFGLKIHSADEIVPDWQERAAGDLMFADSEGTAGWYVMEAQPNQALVVKMANTEAGRPFRRNEPPFMEFTWSFVLKEVDHASRLIVRERVAFKNSLVRFLCAPVGLVSFVMSQRMMRGIKQRAESDRGFHRAQIDRAV